MKMWPREVNIYLRFGGKMHILVVKEKHGTYYFDASTPEKISRAALKILTDRFNGNWYHRPKDESYFWYGFDKEIILTPEEIEALPEHLRAPELKKLKRLESARVELIRAQSWYDEVERIVKEQDASYEEIVLKSGRTRLESPAWNALQDRADYEYEELYLERLEEVE